MNDNDTPQTPPLDPSAAPTGDTPVAHTPAPNDATPPVPATPAPGEAATQPATPPAPAPQAPVVNAGPNATSNQSDIMPQEQKSSSLPWLLGVLGFLLIVAAVVWYFRR